MGGGIARAQGPTHVGAVGEEIPPTSGPVTSGPPHVVVTVDTYKTPRSLWSTSGTNIVFHPPRGSTTPVSTHHLHHHGESSRFPRKKVVHLQIQAYESSTVDRKEMIHKAGFVVPGQLTFSHGGVWWGPGTNLYFTASRLGSKMTGWHVK